ncbi:MAG: fibronectin type III domain-containing protein [Clostridia bacterium]|nr:fibronectin type III domain-containing protein [Clostridia bacterium]
MSKIKNLAKAVVFLILLAVLIHAIDSIFTNTDFRIYQTMTAFYDEPDDKLDGVYIGSSTTYAFWQPNTAWDHYGITVIPLSIPDMPAASLKYMIKEGRKTQPDALYIINLNSFRSAVPDTNHFHFMTDFMKFSLNKIDMVNDLGKRSDIEWYDRLEFLFPVIRFHSNWSNLYKDAVTPEPDLLKGGVHYSTYLSYVKDVTGMYNYSEETSEIDAEKADILEGLLSYCEEDDVNVLFILAPQADLNDESHAELNAIAKVTEERGFPTLNLVNKIDEIGLDTTLDFYNGKHTNIHGSLKFTKYLCEYLTENYDFEDKRGREEYSDWDEASEKYRGMIDEYVLDFELTDPVRDYTLGAPWITTTVLGNDIALGWTASYGADGYLLYRKSKPVEGGDSTAWELVDSFGYETLEYRDEGLKSGTKYTYTVVPVKTVDEVVNYGKFNHVGITAEIKAEG